MAEVAGARWAAEYVNGSDGAFLVWFWHELYSDEPFDASILTRLKALPEPFAERLDSKASHNVNEAADAGAWDKALELLLAGLAESGAPVSPVAREELTALLAAIGQPAAAVSALSVRTALPPAAAGSAHSLLQHRLPPA